LFMGAAGAPRPRLPTFAQHSNTLAAPTSPPSHPPPPASWTQLPSLVTARQWGAAAFLGGALCVTGGSVGGKGKLLESTECLAPNALAWVEGPPLPYARKAFWHAVLDGVWYVGGGEIASGSFSHPEYNNATVDNNNDVVGDDIDFLAPPYAEWTKGPQHEWARREHAAAAAFGSKIYLTGGIDNLGVFLDTTVAFDPKSGEWAYVASAPVNMDMAMAASHAVGLLFFGGRGGKAPLSVWDTTYEYVPETDAWIDAPTLPHPLLRACAVSLDGTVYTVGGKKTNGKVVANHPAGVDEVFALGPGATNWTLVTSVPKTPSGLVHAMCAAFEGAIYVMGGMSAEVQREGILNGTDWGPRDLVWRYGPL